MTTHEFGSLMCRIAAALVVFAVALMIFSSIVRGLEFLIVPGLLMAATFFIDRCIECGKSAFVMDFYETEALGFLNPQRWTPERLCSRCGADLTTQRLL